VLIFSYDASPFLGLRRTNRKKKNVYQEEFGAQKFSLFLSIKIHFIMEKKRHEASFPQLLISKHQSSNYNVKIWHSTDRATDIVSNP